MDKSLPAIPAKRYFTIGEVSELCGVKPYVLRYWEQEFTQLKPMKRRGNRRYYQHHEVLLIRRIRDLLYDQGFTISGARNRLAEAAAARTLHDDADAEPPRQGDGVRFDTGAAARDGTVPDDDTEGLTTTLAGEASPAVEHQHRIPSIGAAMLRAELLSIRELLTC